MLKEHRKALHRIPELGFQEFKTKAYIYEQVKDYRCQLHEVGETGLILYFDNGQAETLAFRTDIDALPIQEQTSHDFPSEHPGRMHACGHDGHTAMLLALAAHLEAQATEFAYNAVLIFQPSEEIAGGAASIVASGWLDFYQVKGVFGFHLWPGLAQGQIFSRSGEMMAQSSEMDMIVHGESAHVASAALGVDALAIACQLVTDIYAFERQLPAADYRLIKFGLIEGGTVRNVLADQVRLAGSIRSYSDEHQTYYKESLARMAQGYEDATGCRVEFRYNDGYPALINDPQLFQRVQATVPDLHTLGTPVLQAEDFGVYTQKYPCVFMFLGVGETAPLHHPAFDFEMDVLEVGVNAYLRLLQLAKI